MNYKLGIFDSGLGGLLITKSIRNSLPDTDLLYLGDTLHLPYGNRSRDAIEYYTRRAIDKMFQLDCKLIVMACNTASAACLRQLQQDYLPQNWPDRNVIGVVVPTLESAVESGFKNLGMISTRYTAESKIYEEELEKIKPDISLQSIVTPLLVPLIENEGSPWIEDVLSSYIDRFDLTKLEALILGCTHYVRLKPLLKKLLPSDTKILSQDEIIPAKLVSYLSRHPEYANAIGARGSADFYVTDLTPAYQASANDLYNTAIDIQVVST